MRGPSVSVLLSAAAIAGLVVLALDGCTLDRDGSALTGSSVATSGPSVGGGGSTVSSTTTGGQGGVGASGGAGGTAGMGGMAGMGGTGGGPLEPCMVAACLLWLRADTGVTVNGQQVVQWADQGGQSSNAVQAAPGAQPVLVPASVGGQDALDFAPQRWMDLPSLSSNSTSYTIVAVLDQRSPGTLQQLLSSLGFADFGVAPVTPGLNVGGLQGGAWLEPMGAGAVVGPQFLTWIWDDAQNLLAVYRGTTLLGTAVYSTPISFGLGTTLGKYRANLQQFLDGLLAELIVFPSPLGVGEQAQVWQYVQTRYGL
jgi:hypothetical protein